MSKITFNKNVEVFCCRTDAIQAVPASETLVACCKGTEPLHDKYFHPGHVCELYRHHRRLLPVRGR